MKLVTGLALLFGLLALLPSHAQTYPARQVGADIVAGTPEEFAEHIRSEMTRWGKVIMDAGIKAE